VHAVAIATPAATHRDLAMAALEAGKHVLIEKPLAASYEDGLALVEEAERRSLTLMCDHTYCYTPAVTKIRELISSGDLGELHFIDSVRINLGLVQPDVDVLWDLAPHDLSILDSILPEGMEPLAVAAQGADPIGAGRACIAYLTLRLTGGAIAHVHVNWLSPTKVRSTMIGGSKRTLIWDDLNPAQRVAVFDRGVDVTAADQVHADTRRDMLVSYRSGDVIAPALVEREALGAVVEEFAASIRSGRPALTDGRAGTAGARHPPGRVAQPGLPRRGRGAARQAMTILRQKSGDLGKMTDENEVRGRRILVTGGAGTIGSNLVDLLVREGAGEIVVLDDFSRGRRENLAGALAGGQVRIVEGDIRDPGTVRKATEGAELVFHLAAIRITRCAAEPRVANEVLVDGTFNVLEAAVEAGCARSSRRPRRRSTGWPSSSRPRSATTPTTTTPTTARPRPSTRPSCAASTPCTGSTIWRCATSTSTARGWTSTGSTPRCSSAGWSGSCRANRR
jgi:predicted dehydrogenase